MTVVMVGTLPRREAGASGYQRWTEGDLSEAMRAHVRAVIPTVDCMDPSDADAWAHVAEVLDRPHLRGRPTPPGGAAFPGRQDP